MRPIVRTILALAAVPMAVASSPQTPAATAPDDDLLGHLLGSWTLTGTMGSVTLRQHVEASEVLQGHFVQMHFREVGSEGEGASPYEALYMLGYDAAAGEYVMYLFDTFGVAFSRTMGVGIRQDDAIVFRFDYPDGPFTNTFTWHEDTGTWDMLLRSRNGAGDWETFATKVLTPRGE